jgi:hypothetical protein
MAYPGEAKTASSRKKYLITQIMRGKIATTQARPKPQPKNQKFFASFFQKRSPCFSSPVSSREA